MSARGVSERVLRTHFHTRTAAANHRNAWQDWKGYTTAAEYTAADLEYFAMRNAAGVFDLCPMTKYRITGPEALPYLDRLVTRDMTKLKPGRVAYAVWCNDAGKVIDDGTIFHLREGEYRLCSQERHLEWLLDAADGFDVTVTEETAEVAALALQGPTSCAVLKEMGLTDVEQLKPFGLTRFRFEGTELTVSRTGFTGDLGYELWIDPDHAEILWDRLFLAGKYRGIRAIGSEALELCRIEAGFIQAGVDFLPADGIVRPGRARSPFELGLDWLVDFTKPNFNGRRALAAELRRGSTWRLVKLDIEGNKPAHHSYIYDSRKKQAGFVTSAAWSPVAKANIALASVRRPAGEPGGRLFAEIYYQREMHWSRKMAAATVVEKPFWDPPRRRQTPPADY
ncbi:aminomethyltransferase family protein [Lentisalinibacter sediminis]|uniref:aminomethyltransferase family protein n=1 Tax=Lentisalinibacter sediminis TaxID=2992237 RepID=UPI003870A29A